MQRLSITLCNGNSRFSMPFLLIQSVVNPQPNLRFAILDLQFKIVSQRITVVLTTLATQGGQLHLNDLRIYTLKIL